MDGIHDLGGMSGFGCVAVERDEPVFHQPWEAQVFALNGLGIGKLQTFNADEYRHSVERMDPLHYLMASYYERMLTGVATLLVEKDVVTHEELVVRAGGSFPLARPVPQCPTASLVPQPHARFAVGDRVAVRSFHQPGHTRVPRYVRGKQGIVLHIAPKFSFPDAAAHGLTPRAEHTYHVEFRVRDLWSDADANDTVVVDLWDCYLCDSTWSQHE